MLFTHAKGFAEIQDVGLSNSHTVRIAPSESDDSFYVTRTEANLDYNLVSLDKVIKILPFSEYQHNLDTNGWWRKEIGAEFGMAFFDDYFYYGASFQHIWQREENYSVEELDETTEWESRFVITAPLKWWIFEDKVKLRLFDEYTYDFTRGQGTFNEVGCVLDWQVREGLRLKGGWRHTDRVHDFDADLFELSAVFSL